MSEDVPAGGANAHAAAHPPGVTLLSEEVVSRLLDPVALLDGLAQGFRDLASGAIQTPERRQITVPERGFLLTMSAWREGSPLMVKTVTVFEGNHAHGLPSHLAVINLYSQKTGEALCIMDGTRVTGMRTAGAAVLSVREIARRDARVATIVGAGVQGREHLALLPLVRDFDEILLCSRRYEDAQALARMLPAARAVEDREAAVSRSDVVCLTSHSYEPVIEADWVRPGTHVTSVGFAPPAGELPARLAREHRLFVEHPTAFETPPVGCGELRGIAASRGTPLGDALNGAAPLRTDAEEITVYKSMGIAMEDLVAAELVYRAACAADYGSFPSTCISAPITSS